MLFAGRTFFICGLLLLIFECATFAYGGYAAKREVIEVSERYHVVVGSTLDISIFAIPSLMAFTVTLGALGCVQHWIALPEFLRRTCAYVFAAGVLTKTAGFFLQAFTLVSDAKQPPAYWFDLAGSLLLTLPFILQSCGFLVSLKRDSGGREMKAARLYVLGSLLLMLWLFARAFWPGWPWYQLAVGFSTIYAGAFVWPLAAVLSALGLFLAAVQSQISFPMRFKLAGVVLYFSGTVVFLYFFLLRERAWERQITWPTFVGIAVVAAALSLNLIGLIGRGQQQTEAEAGAP